MGGVKNIVLCKKLKEKQDQGSNAPSTSAFHQANNELLMYIQYLMTNGVYRYTSAPNWYTIILNYFFRNHYFHIF